MNIFTVNFNTSGFTNNLIKSILINLKSFPYRFFIFDNSDQDKKFTLDNDLSQFSQYINVIDNTESKYIDFNKVLNDNVDQEHYKKNSCNDHSHHGTLKHSYTIDWLIQQNKDDFILFDSDTVLMRDIDFIDTKAITACGICYQEPKWKNRCLPFIQYFNVPMIKSSGIRYFDKDRILFGNNPVNNLIYDTGASFYEDIKKNNLPIKEINFNNYIVHFGGGSWIKSEAYRRYQNFNYSR